MSLFLDGAPALLCGVVPLLTCTGVTPATATATTTTTTTSPSVSSSSHTNTPPAASSASVQFLQHELTQRLQSTLSLTSNANPQGGHHDEETDPAILRLRRRQQARVEAGRSKSGIWGPTHSMDSEDTTTSSSSNSNTKGLKKKNAALHGAGDSPRTIVPPSQRHGNDSPKASVKVITESSTPTSTRSKNMGAAESPTKPQDPNPQGSSSSTSSSSSPTSTKRSGSLNTGREQPPNAVPAATATTTSSSVQQPQHEVDEPLEKSIWERATCTMLATAPRYYFWKRQHSSQPSPPKPRDDSATVGTQNSTSPTPFPDATKALKRHADMLAEFMEDACGGKHNSTRSLEIMGQLTFDVKSGDSRTANDDDDDDHDEVVVHEDVEVDVNAPFPLGSGVSQPPAKTNITAPMAIELAAALQQRLEQSSLRDGEAEQSSLRLVAEVSRTFQDSPMVSRTTSAAITEHTGGLPGPTTTGTLDPPTLPRMSSIATTETPVSRRRFRHFQKQSPPHPKPQKSPPSPPQEVAVPSPQRPSSASPTSMAVLKPTSTMPPLAPQPPTALAAAAASHHRALLAAEEAAAGDFGKNAKGTTIPLEMLTVQLQDAKELERSISELTMRSSYAEATAKISEQRRMAYYAVGRHHRNSGRGGNRRCYFSGKLILGGAPFYAGSVQQGLRTLVVFCLPSAIGLPLGVDLRRQESLSSYASRTSGLPSSTSLTASQSSGALNPSTPLNRELAIGVVAQPRTVGSTTLHNSSSSTSAPPQNVVDGRLGMLEREQRSSLRTSRSKRTYSASGSVGQHSKISSLDDMSLSIEEDLDPNWGLDRDYLLQVLPEPDQELLDEMAKRYPEQFETLPVQVRSPHCWRLFVKFCFFSGLPIAEGEMHYKVRDEIAQEAYGEEIILSHEVMEAVNGDSAEILRLPNQKTFRYLRKHYTQQSGKLPDVVFRRQSWILVRPEV